MKRIFVLLVLLATLTAGCNRSKRSSACIPLNRETEKRDTLICSVAEYPGFQIYVKCTYRDLFFEDMYQCYCSVHLNSTDKSVPLFWVHFHLRDAPPVEIEPDYFIFPFASGGNCHWCVGYNVFKVTPDTAFVVGTVSGYDDIDDDQKPELYTFELVEYGQGHAFDVLEKVPVYIVNDSLSYPFPNGYAMYRID